VEQRKSIITASGAMNEINSTWTSISR